jgi:ketosteroid isomerase-like protein
MKMKTIIILPFFVTTIIFCGPLSAQQSTTNEQWAVQQIVKNIFDVLSNRDSTILKNYCTADVAFYEYGMVWTIDSIIQKAILQNTATDFKRENTIDFINTTINGNTAWATYNLHSVIRKEGKETKIHWMETVVLIKENNMWRLKVLHSTLIKRS